MGFERNYQVKIPSNQIIKLKYYQTDSNLENMNHSLNPHFITGFQMLNLPL